MLLLADACDRRGDRGRAPIGWALAWWGLVLYWVAGGVLRRPGGRLMRAARRPGRRRERAAAARARPDRAYAPDFLTELFRNPLDPGYADAAARRAEHGPAGPRRRLPGRGSSRPSSLVADRVPVRGRLPADGRRRAGPQPGPRRPGRRDQGRARPAPTSCSARRRSCATRSPASGTRRWAAASRGAGCANLEAATGLAPGDAATASWSRLADAPAPIDPITGGRRRTVGRVLDRGPAGGRQRAVERRRRGDRDQRPAADRDVDDPGGRRARSWSTSGR